jgi:dihydroflavonol-4-reductase
MQYSSAKPMRELGYHSRPAEDAVRDAIDWFRCNGYLANIPEISVSPSGAAQ